MVDEKGDKLIIYKKTSFLKRCSQSYELADGIIRATGKHGVLYSPWHFASDIFHEMAMPEGGPVAKRENITEGKKYIHLEFASSNTEAKIMHWVTDYGLPYLNSKSQWWEESGFREDDEKELPVSELLFWAEVANWIFLVMEAYKKKSTFPAMTPTINEVISIMKINVEPLPLYDIHHKVELPVRIVKDIMNCASSRTHPHFFISASVTPSWGWAVSNLMQFVFLNILADITGGSNLSRCPCGRWIPPSISSTKEYCSPTCRQKYKKRRYRLRKDQKNKQEAQNRERID